MVLKYRINFNLVSRKDIEKNLPVRMRVNYSGYTVDFTTGILVDREKWDSDSGTVFPGKSNKEKQFTKDSNKRIQELGNFMEQVFTRFEHIEKRTPTPKELRNSFNALTGKRKKRGSDELTVLYYFDDFILRMSKKNNWAQGSIQKLNTVKNHLKKFDDKLKLSEVTEEKLDAFVDYLHKIGNRNTTIAKEMGFIRWFLRWAFFNDYFFGKLHQTYRPKFKGTDGNQKEIVFLTWQELQTLYYFQFSEEDKHLEVVRDIFCFMCFTGLRFSDMKKLRWTDITDDAINVVTAKTVDFIKVELNKYSSELLEKYRGIKFNNEMIMPVTDNTRQNKKIQAMAKVVGLDAPQKIIYFKRNQRFEKVVPKHEVLSTHCGRRTFIISALYLGIAAEVIMKWTGHSDYKSMKPYIKIIDELKATEMKKFDAFLN